MPDIAQDRVRAQKFTTAGGTTAYTATVPNLAALYDGFRIVVKMNATNTGASTLNVNGIGAKTIKKPGVLDVAANDLLINSCYELMYDLAQDFFFLLRVVFTSSGGGGGLPTDTITMLCAANGFNGRDNTTPLRSARVGFIETASYVYACIAIFLINNNDDKIYYRMFVQKINKTTQVLDTTYISNPIWYTVAGFGIGTADTYLRDDGSIFYAVFEDGGLFRYLTFDTATDTFGATVISGAAQEFGVFNILANTATADSALVDSTLQLYTSAATNVANPGGNSANTLTVGANTYGITYFYVGSSFNGTDDPDTMAVLAFVTYT